MPIYIVQSLNKTFLMKRSFLFRLAAITILSVCSLCLKSEKIDCPVDMMSSLHIIKSAQIKNPDETKNNADGLLPYHPLIIKI